MNRREFCRAASLLVFTARALPTLSWAVEPPISAPSITVADLPEGAAPPPVSLPHFPDRLHAFIWRNWPLVPRERLARAIGASPAQVSDMARSLGLPRQKKIPSQQLKRTALTIIRRNWHLVPYEQLLTLLDWTPSQMAFALKEDDFLYIKLGSRKPRCAALRYESPDAETKSRARELAALLRREFPSGPHPGPEPLFGFLEDLMRSGAPRKAKTAAPTAGRPRFCYSYFALYGDPLLEPELDPYPDAYLDRLRQVGVNGVWLQAVLHQLAPFPWDPSLSQHWQRRLDNLRTLAARCRARGIGLYLYLNEPRTMPLRFFESHPELKGVVVGDTATLCTSHPDVQTHIETSIATICQVAPELAGFFTITASENPTNCWSHGRGADCPRCSKRSPGEVVAQVNELVARGIRKAGSKATLFAWDWGWADGWIEDAVKALPPEAALMSVSEWSIPIQRGGTASVIGEYSISVVGPGPRARKHWSLARARGLRTLAKIQAGNTWELSAVPYIPALENVAQHLSNLQAEKVDGLMLGWTLGGYPSPNLEVVSEIEQAGGRITVEEALQRVANRLYGEAATPGVVTAWKKCSAAFRQFPFHGGLVYSAPMQYGPSNLLWEKPTGHPASMVGFPYDDLNAWRAVYPAGTFVKLFEEMGAGFQAAAEDLDSSVRTQKKGLSRRQRFDIERELNVMRACAIHFGTVANQGKFILARQALGQAKSQTEARGLIDKIESLLRDEIRLAKELHAIQSRDSRIGFEASNQYYYIPSDLVEKVINCQDLLSRWVPAQRAALHSAGG